jgi:hypothetical protein
MYNVFAIYLYIHEKEDAVKEYAPEGPFLDIAVRNRIK